MPSLKGMRTHLNLLRPLLTNASLDAARKGQNRIGELIEAAWRREVVVKEHAFADFESAWLIPKDERRQGVVLYLHGGGFTCGDLEYAKGVGAAFAARYGTRVFAPAYRLAPEHPYPAALEDCFLAYTYLLQKGYGPEHITLCGESAGGGLCYSLCLKLRQQGLAMPAGIIAVSPWVDLTLSGPSVEENEEKDPALTRQMLEFYARCYTAGQAAPLAQVLEQDLKGLPESLLFAGGDELLLWDSQSLHKALRAADCRSSLTVAPGRWHGYLLYGMKEDVKDLAFINTFLNRVMAQEDKLRWMRLDNAAKLYPAARNQRWSNLFRVSATLTEEVDPQVLQAALDVTVRRFPSLAARLRKGVFWYYLQQLSKAPAITPESSYPLVRMSRRETRECAFRVLVYRRRIAVEMFHSLTDGTGALIFLKTLVAEYLHQRHGLQIPPERGVLGRLEDPSEEELEDSFTRYAGAVSAQRQEQDAYRLSGTPEIGGFLNITCLQLPASVLVDVAHSHGVSVTAFLTAAMIMAIQRIQARHIPNPRYRKPIRVQVPVNLRTLFPSRSVRNFALYTTPEIDPRLGEYTFREICQAVHHRMGLEINPKVMSAKVAANVVFERMWVVRALPLFLKNIAMKLVFKTIGERKSCLSLSNLGRETLPEVMAPYVERMDFILSGQATAPHNCGVITWNGTAYVNVTRNVREPELEAAFSQVLQELGIPVTVRSNSPQRKGD